MIALIAAVSRNGVIGKDGKIPWRLPEDLKRFKALTLGHVLVMGRKTYESIGHPLPGRQTIVLSRSLAQTREIDAVSSRRDDAVAWSVKASVSLDEVLSWNRRESATIYARKALFICGGVEVYREALERDVVDKVYLTQIDADFEGDTSFPFVHELFSEPRWQLMKETEWLGSWSTPETFPHRYWFREYDRKR